MTRTIRKVNKQRGEGYQRCRCKRCQDDRRYNDERKEREAQEALKETRKEER
jgi:hypothetical protein